MNFLFKYVKIEKLSVVLAIKSKDIKYVKHFILSGISVNIPYLLSLYSGSLFHV